MILLIKNLKWSLFYRSEGGPWVAARQSLHLQSPPIICICHQKIYKYDYESWSYEDIMMAIRARLLLYQPKKNERVNKKPSPPRDGAGRLHDLQDPEMSFGQYLFFKNAALFICCCDNKNAQLVLMFLGQYYNTIQILRILSKQRNIQLCLFIFHL